MESRSANRSLTRIANRAFHALRFVGPVFVVLIMLLSSGGILAPRSVGSGTLAAPHAFYTPATTEKVLSGAALAKSPYLTTPGNSLQTHPNAKVLGSPALSTPVSFTIGFPMRNTQQLEQIIQAQQSVGSPSYHQWLTLAQEQQLIAPDPVVVQNTINYFTSLGFHVQTQGLLSVSFVGTAGATDLAFRTSLAQIQDPGTVSYTHLTLPTICSV